MHWCAAIMLHNWSAAILIGALFLLLMVSADLLQIQVFLFLMLMIATMFSWQTNIARVLGTAYFSLAFLLNLGLGLRIEPWLVVIVLAAAISLATLVSKSDARWPAMALIAGATVYFEHRIHESRLLIKSFNDLTEVMARPYLQRYGALLFNFSLGRFAWLCAGAFLVHGVFRCASKVDFVRLWSRLPKRKSIFMAVKIPRARAILRLPLLGPLYSLFFVGLGMLATLGLAIFEIFWYITYWVVVFFECSFELACRVIVFVGTLLWFVTIHTLLRLSWGFWTIVCIGSAILISFGMPICLSLIGTNLIERSSRAMFATFFDGSDLTAITWTITWICFGVIWSRFGDWLICPNGSVLWWRDFSVLTSPILVLQSTNSRHRLGQNAEASSNLLMYYFVRKIGAGCIVCLLVCEIFGHFGIGPFRFGLTMTAISLAIASAAVFFLGRWVWGES
jgi:hypothetical protein